GRRREVGTRGQDRNNHLAAVADALRGRADDHAVLDPARARRDEHPRALDLDHAHPARVDGRERLAVAERRDVHALPAARLQDRLALAGAHLLAVDLDLHRPPQRDRNRAHATPSAVNGRSALIAESIAFAAVWPRPQIDASRMPRAISSSSTISSPTDPRG